MTRAEADQRAEKRERLQDNLDSPLPSDTIRDMRAHLDHIYNLPTNQRLDMAAQLRDIETQLRNLTFASQTTAVNTLRAALAAGTIQIEVTVK